MTHLLPSLRLLPSVGDSGSAISAENVAGKTALLARKIESQMKRYKLSKQQLANLMDVQPSIITRWLSGTHNFTITTLFEIEEKLRIRLVDLGPTEYISQTHIMFHLSVDNSTATHLDPQKLIGVVDRVNKCEESTKQLNEDPISFMDQSLKYLKILQFKESF